MRVLSATALRTALPMPHAIAAVRNAFAQLHKGRAVAPVRTVMAAAGGHTLLMPAWLPDDNALAVKIASVRPDNPARGLPRVQGLVVAFDPDRGDPIAILHGGTLTALRTAAVSGLAIDLLARREPAVLAVLGAGALARDHVAAVRSVREVREVRVFAPTQAHAEAVAADVSGRAVRSAAEAVRGADIVVTVTSSPQPVFDDADLSPGATIAAVGAWQPETAEIGARTMARAAVFVEDRQAAWAESGDLGLARQSGHIGPDHVAADLGALVAGAHPGRTDPDGIVVFESVGLAVEDAAVAAAAVAAAAEVGLGGIVEL